MGLLDDAFKSVFGVFDPVVDVIEDVGQYVGDIFDPDVPNLSNRKGLGGGPVGVWESFQDVDVPPVEFSPIPLPEDVATDPAGDLVTATEETFRLGRQAFRSNVSKFLIGRELVSPGIGETQRDLTEVTQSFLAGEVPADVQRQIEINALEGQVRSGAGAGQLSRNIVPRDLGLTSLQLQEVGSRNALSQLQIANTTASALVPDVFTAAQRRGEFLTSTDLAEQQFNVAAEQEALRFNASGGLSASQSNAANAVSVRGQNVSMANTEAQLANQRYLAEQNLYAQQQLLEFQAQQAGLNNFFKLAGLGIGGAMVLNQMGMLGGGSLGSMGGVGSAPGLGQASYVTHGTPYLSGAPAVTNQGGMLIGPGGGVSGIPYGTGAGGLGPTNSVFNQMLA